MNQHSCVKTLAWMLFVGVWLTIPAVTDARSTRCTTKSPLCRSLAPYFVDEDNPLKKTSITNRQTLSTEYDLVVLLAKKKGFFIVHSKTGKHYLTITMLPDGMWWDLKRVAHDSIVLTDHDEYGALYNKVKYFFDLPAKQVFSPQDLKEVKVHQANVYKNKLVMTGMTVSRARRGEKSVVLRWSDREKSKGAFEHQLIRAVNREPLEPIQIVQEENGKLQFMAKPFQYTFSDAGWKKTMMPDTRKSVEALGFPKLRDSIPLAVVKENLLVRSVGENQERRFLVWNQNLNSSITTGVKVWNEGAVEFYPLPQPSYELFETLRPTRSVGYKHNMATVIGPFQFYEGNIWFGLAFPDAEGESGVGGYGYFNTKTLGYHIHYRPEWAEWAVSAFSVKGNKIWVGLFRQGERSTASNGAIRHDLKTGESLHLKIPEIVHVIQEWQGAVFFGTDNGVWILDDEQLTQGYFTVDQHGVYQLEWDTPLSVHELNAEVRAH